ncbi:hypothetical protein B0H14DRAFT_32035 [Mycena olivaceomarginata]|nr:hypothetical protein B0H14DRAFT_32035 [Mycena olivaceomarginata]
MPTLTSTPLLPGPFVSTSPNLSLSRRLFTKCLSGPTIRIRTRIQNSTWSLTTRNTSPSPPTVPSMLHILLWRSKPRSTSPSFLSHPSHFSTTPTTPGPRSQSRAELEHALPSEVKKGLFLLDEGCLRSMGDELFSTLIDAFMDVCLSRLRFTTSIPSPNTSSKSGGASVSAPSPLHPPFLRALTLSFRRLSRNIIWRRSSIWIDAMRLSWTLPCAPFFASARYRLVVRRRALRVPGIIPFSSLL